MLFGDFYAHPHPELRGKGPFPWLGVKFQGLGGGGGGGLRRGGWWGVRGGGGGGGGGGRGSVCVKGWNRSPDTPKSQISQGTRK